MRRVFLAIAVVGLAVACLVWFTVPGLALVRPPIRVGLLHSRTGPMAANELSMLDAEALAIEEINAQGGATRPPGRIRHGRR